ncbi:ribulose-5-phosphate 4-epimerase/fuculose-1-phosphate aldolase [Rhodococcus sp. LBL1]|nr:ribulose-5-phosphate 4-epimerase/fuculose-1-phosphate aldolase [Rhodococcus sp. LBL1]MDH6682606.1 ribulose-5-phosphate 4-epimerase/fuculose-1-phosphate aldolase [Rhodococcus sp. LBL2]
MTAIDESTKSAEPESNSMDGWKPRAVPPIGAELTNEQKLACAFRTLAHDGFSENMAGHITWADRDDDSLLINPWGLWWEEVSASDVCRVDAEGKVVEGKWDVTPAYHIHTELHRRRPDARVVVHNHPYYVTLLAAVGVLPTIAHQTGSLYDDDLSLVHEYGGEISDAELGRDLADKIGDRNNVILASHGIITTADTIELAVYRAASIDRFCQLAYDILLLGKDPLPIEKNIRVAMQKALVERAAGVYWAGAVRKLLRTDPDVLN